MEGKLKGQFFILGSILLIIAFFLGLPQGRPSLLSPSSDLQYISYNIKTEFPPAFNIGLNQSSEQSILKNFTRFLNESFLDNQVSFAALWVYSRNSSSSSNLTIGNFLGSNITINLTIGSTERLVEVRNNDTNSTLFTSPGQIFNLTIEFNSRSSTVEWLRDKASLFVFYEIGRGSSLVREEFSS